MPNETPRWEIFDIEDGQGMYYCFKDTIYGEVVERISCPFSNQIYYLATKFFSDAEETDVFPVLHLAKNYVEYHFIGCLLLDGLEKEKAQD